MLNITNRSQFIFIAIFFIFLKPIYSFEVQDSGINASSSRTVGSWSITHYYPTEINIIRSSTETTGNATLTFSGIFFDATNTTESDGIGFRYVLDSTNSISGKFTSASSSGGAGFSVTGPDITGGGIDVSIDKPTSISTLSVSGDLQITIPLSLDDGTYNLTCLLASIPIDGDPDFSSQNLPLNIITTPVVQVDDIDFGRQIQGAGEIIETSNISITGKEDAELSFTLDTTGLFIKSGSSDTISFESKIIDDSHIIEDGEHNATLQVSTTILEDTPSGNYTGSIRVIVQHN